MEPLIYATGNPLKFRQASLTCESFGIALLQKKLDIPEIQAETGEPVARDKAMKAFALLERPLVVSDDSWMIPGLNNFPGPYMKYMNDWFSSEDWLRLTSTLSDRRIILRQIVAYQDADRQRTFALDIPGVLLPEPRGVSDYPHTTIVSFDNGRTSMAEHHERGESVVQQRSPWHDFSEWCVSTAVR